VVNYELYERTGAYAVVRLNLNAGGGSEWESNPPSKPAKGSNSSFEGCENHRALCASVVGL